MSKHYIPNARAYSVVLPAFTTLNDRLRDQHHEPIGSLQTIASGFISMDEFHGNSPVDNDYENSPMVQPLGDKYAVFFHKQEHRTVPAAQLKAETEKRLRAIENDTGRKANKETRKLAKEAAIQRLLPLTAPVARITPVFYHAESGTLIVPAASQKLADRITSDLCKACVSLKVQTVYVSLGGSLTEKLKKWITEVDSDQDAYSLFRSFQPAGSVHLDGIEERATFAFETLAQAQSAGLEQALARGLRVTKLELVADDGDGLAFDLDSKFRLSRVRQPDDVLNDVRKSAADTTIEHQFASQALFEASAVTAVFQELIALFDYVAQTEPDAPQAPADGPVL